MTRLDYCQFLLASQTNFTLTYFADHTEHRSHDAINRYLRDSRVTPRILWDNVRTEVVPHEHGYLLFDDTVLDKRRSRHIEPARRQWSGNAKGTVEGIGVVTCVYVNPVARQFWIIDYRLYAPDTDGKTKLTHVAEMMKHTVHHERTRAPDGAEAALPFRTVLMDAWYATMPLWKLIEALGKVYYCPVRGNRQVSLGVGQPYGRIDALPGEDAGRLVHLKGMPKGHQ